MPEIEDLIKGIVNEDEMAFNALVSQYWGRIYNYAFTFCKSRETAMETTQDVFIKIWRKHKLLAEVSNFDSYIFAIVRNTIVNNIKANLQAVISLDSNEFIHLEENNRPDVQYSAKDLQKRLIDIIETLPPVRKKVFRLHRTDGKTYDEIAQLLNISKNTVKEHIKLSHKYIRSFLADEGLASVLITVLLINF